ncbi:MAG: arginase family protein [Bdellovibrionota bacterium]
MTKPLNTQSEKRQLESLSSRFGASDGSEVIFVKSSSDIGVIRNGGRNGARLAPQSLLSFFRKLALDQKGAKFNFREVEVSSQDEEKSDFKNAQEKEALKIEAIVSSHPDARLIHIGGGHDHIYPLLKSYSHKKKVIVLNLDAHADTRTDSDSHSGTPFRQFAAEYKGEFHLFQLGLHVFANSESTLSPLPSGEMHVLWRKDMMDQSKWTSFFDEMKKLIDDQTVVIFSLDADALSGELVPGVSAVNGLGLKTNELFQAWGLYRALPMKHPPIMGIYELNPVYDTLSGMSMRFMSNFLFVSLRE